MIIAVDFDGTCVTHEYPKVGQEVVWAIGTLQELVDKGHFLILYTMRSGLQLEDAVSWFEKNGIELWAVNENPEQSEWTSSPKVYANLYIDDAALGCPLTYQRCGRPFVNWPAVRRMLQEENLLCG